MIHMLIFVFAYSVFLTLLCGVKENKPTKLTCLYVIIMGWDAPLVF